MKPNQTKTKQKQTNTWTLESEVWRCSQTAVQSSWLVSMPHIPVLCKGRDRGARKHLGSKFSVGSIKSMWPVGIADMKHKGRWNPGPLWELASYLSSPGWKAQMLGGSSCILLFEEPSKVRGEWEVDSLCFSWLQKKRTSVHMLV